MAEETEIDAVTINPEDGLTDFERQFLTTPLKDLTPDQRMTAVAISEKKANFIYAKNEEWRAAKRAEEAKRYESGEVNVRQAI